MDYETRSAEPIETRNEDDHDDGLNTAVAAVDELRTAVEEHRSATDERITTELRGITERLDAIDLRTQRPGNRTEERRDDNAIERRAFTGFLRHGREGLPADEVRSLRVADDTAGGYLAPAQFVAEVIKGIVEVSPVRQAARVGSTASGSVILPKRTGRPTARWVGETETRTGTESTYGQVEIPVHEMAAYVDVSLRLLEDAAVNVESEVAMDLAEEFGRLEGVALVNGDGFKKPTGFMTDTNVEFTPTGNASTLGSAPADTLIDLMYAVPAFYRNSGVWMMNGNTLAAIRKLKDGQNNFLWQPSYQAGQPETILGRPVIEAPDMDDVGSAAEPIVFGDFARAYRIYDRLQLSIMRDPYSQATSGLVRFHARRRIGGGVVLAEALRKLKCATS
ncbi:phage major capsid protein [Acuticoccus sediminis]|uniref:Phage major capsid protein n=1 Tax=Acuticoccus sediminis TaxID=2184697 RepID=A0A8B2NK40_9HYPH|nr:phage major capsid protein [Acuticoccus sediminis]RAH99855.1 phage major capsid protein [Acuticoccus sediminis]